MSQPGSRALAEALKNLQNMAETSICRTRSVAEKAGMCQTGGPALIMGAPTGRTAPGGSLTELRMEPEGTVARGNAP